MSNIFRNSGNALRGSHYIIPAYVVFVLMLIIGVALGIEDYSTSRLGYEMFPTAKANDWVIPIVALVPQVGQVGFALVFMFDTRKRWSAAISGALFIADVMTDIWFKTGGMKLGPITLLFAVPETITLYTLGSEIMLTVAFGMVLELFPDFAKKIGELFERLLSMFSDTPTAAQPQTGSAPSEKPEHKAPFPRDAMDRAKSKEERKRIYDQWRAAQNEPKPAGADGKNQ